MRRWNLICKRASQALLLLAGLLSASATVAATYNLSFGQRPYCSTSWSVSGSVFECTGNGDIRLGFGDVVTANSPATLIANNGFELRNATVGSSSNPIKIQSSYGAINAAGATLFGDLQASSGTIDLNNTSVTGSIQTGGFIELDGGSVSGDVTSSSNQITLDDALVQGTVTALGNIMLTDSSITGKVTSTSNGIITEDSDLLGGAQANNDILITGGTLTGDINSTSNNLVLTDVTMTSGTLSGGRIRIEDSNLGGATGVVNANARNGNITLINSSVVYGDLTAPSYATIDVSDDSQVFGTCTPLSPGCINRPPLNCPVDVGLFGEYFDGTDLDEPAAFGRVDEEIDFDWGNDSPNRNALGRNEYSIRWTGYLRAPTDAPFDIAVRSDDGARLSVDEFLVIDEWQNQGATLHDAELDLVANRYYSIELEYYEDGGDASVQLLWDITDDGNRNFTVIPVSFLVHCTALLPTPLLEWRMDEQQWNGSDDEVSDSSGNDRNGTGGGNVSTVSGRLCRAGEFDGADDYIFAPSLYGALRGTASFSFWVRTTASGNNTPYLAPGISGIEQSGGTDDIFWGWLDANGRIGLAVGDRTDGKSNQSINDGTYHHVVLIRDAGNGDYRIYIDGELDQSGRQASGRINNRFESLGRVENTAGGPKYFRGELDEVLVFEQQLSSGEVKLLYDLQRQGKNLDGSDRDLSQCGGISQICISDNFNSSLDTDRWSVSGTGFTPRQQGNRLRLTDDDTNIATAATLLQRFPSAGNRIQVEFDYYAYTNNDDAADGVALVLSDANVTPVPGGYGGSLGYAQNSNSGDDGFSGGWLGIGLDEFGNYANATEGRQGGVGQRPNSVSVRGSGDGNNGYAYLGGTAANLSPTVVTGRNSPHRYRLTIDNRNTDQALVTVDRDTDRNGTFDRLVGPIDVLNHPGQSAVPAQLLLTLTGSTGGDSANHEIDNLEVCATNIEPYEPPIHHFELDRNRNNGLTCEPLAITVRACLDAACTSQYDESFDITLSAGSNARGVSGDNIDSGEQLNLWLTNSGNYGLSVLSSSSAASNATRCFVNGIQQSNCNFSMADTGLRFIDPNNANQSLAVLDLVAGRADSFRVQAVQTNQTTGICEGIFGNGDTLTFHAGTECSNPSTCLPEERVVLTQHNTDHDLPNPQDTDSDAVQTEVPLQFGANSTAEFELLAPDVGLQPLLLSFELTDPDSDPADILVFNEQVDLRVRPASLLLHNIRTATSDDHPTAVDLPAGVTDSANSPVFAQANQPFVVSIQALDAEGKPTLNFGRTTNLPLLNWATSSLAYPTSGAAGQVNGSNAQTSPDDDWQVESLDSSVITLNNDDALRFTDLGVVQLSATIDAYLGTTETVASNQPLVGRFIPARLGVSQSGTADWGSRAYIYQGQSAVLNGLTLNVTAYDSDGTVLKNYDGELFKLSLNQANWLQRPLSNTGDALAYSLSPSSWPQPTAASATYTGSVSMVMNDLALTWPRNTSGPSANDTVQAITNFVLGQAALTDSDGVCFVGDSNACEALELKLSQTIDLYYGRLNADLRASGTPEQVALNVWTEIWDQDNSVWRFITFNGDNHTSSTDLTGLTPTGTCRIEGNNAPDALCASIAASAQLTGLNNGMGFFIVDGNDQIGEVGVRTQVPTWLSWDWDSDSTTPANGPESLLFFGQFTGRPPLLFQAPGFR